MSTPHDTDHAAAIQGQLDNIPVRDGDHISSVSKARIIEHADALQAQLEASESQVKRYRDAFDAVMVVLSGDASTEAWAAVGVTCADLRKHRDLTSEGE